uniref:hypothetical protein n=1 Tax=Phocaeicola sp. TaxID=2773926 RepID=UPI0040296364
NFNRFALYLRILKKHFVSSCERVSFNLNKTMCLTILDILINYPTFVIDTGLKVFSLMQK